MKKVIFSAIAVVALSCTMGFARTNTVVGHASGVKAACACAPHCTPQTCTCDEGCCNGGACCSGCGK